MKTSISIILIALLAIGAGLGYLLYQQNRHDRDLDQSTEQQLSRLTDEVAEKAAQLQATQQRVAELQERLHESHADAESLRNALNESRAELSRIYASADAQRYDGSAVEGDNDKLREICSALSSELKENIERQEATVEQREQGVSVTLVDRVLFDFASTALTEKGQEILERAGKAVKDSEGMRIRVVGHADNVPISSEFRHFYPTNWELSTARAAAVVTYLQKEVKIAPKTLEAVGRSYYQPIAGNETEEGRAKNRRVEIIIAPPYSQVASSEAP